MATDSIRRIQKQLERRRSQATSKKKPEKSMGLLGRRPAKEKPETEADQLDIINGYIDEIRKAREEILRGRK